MTDQSIEDANSKRAELHQLDDFGDFVVSRGHLDRIKDYEPRVDHLKELMHSLKLLCDDYAARQSSQSEPVAWANKDLTLVTTVKALDGSMRNKGCGFGNEGVPLYLSAPQQAIPAGILGWFVYVSENHHDVCMVDSEKADYYKAQNLRMLPLVIAAPQQAIPSEATEEMKDGARSFLGGLELGIKSFEHMASHLELSGAYLPRWFLESKGHLNKMAKAHYIYEAMLSASPTAPIEPKESIANKLKRLGFQPPPDDAPIDNVAEALEKAASIAKDAESMWGDNFTKKYGDVTCEQAIRNLIPDTQANKESE
jgi:hypothetical protein